jgi:hypothetical protein
MVRRKYRKPQGYRDGGAVPVENIIVAEPVSVHAQVPPEQLAPAAAAPSPPAPSDDGADALVRAAHAQARADELQRQAAQRRPTVEEHIDRLDLSDHKKRFLRQHPSMAVDPGEMQALTFHYQAALGRGIPDDTESMDAAILAGMFRERERADQDKAPPAEAPPPAPSPLASRKSTSLPMSAPVSRAVPSYASGERRSTSKTLSPAEVQIARASIIDRPDMPKLTDAQKEYIYLQQREKYRAMKQDGSYSEQGGRSPTFRAGYRDD